jgi:hypothetical protein
MITVGRPGQVRRATAWQVAFAVAGLFAAIREYAARRETRASAWYAGYASAMDDMSASLISANRRREKAS